MSGETPWAEELEELQLRLEFSRAMGGAEGIDRQHSLGKLTVTVVPLRPRMTIRPASCCTNVCINCQPNDCGWRKSVFAGIPTPSSRTCK